MLPTDLYADVARDLARKANPGATAAQIEAAAKKGWESTTLQWLLQTIALAKRLRPKATCQPRLALLHPPTRRRSG